ncbi:MAG: hypothetical protein LBM27_01315 [Lactobacillaceae bacterium]|jgi:polyhydroxyalkanoate synthesis regulator phasin|nr:hypothetical protein [Lactobacillaceae bacterium]
MTKEQANLLADEMLKQMYEDSKKVAEEGMNSFYGINPDLEDVDKKYRVIRKNGEIVSINGTPV